MNSEKKQSVDDVIFAKAMRRGANFTLIAMQHGITRQEVLKVMVDRGVIPKELQ